jgi:hypothetical protein
MATEGIKIKKILIEKQKELELKYLIWHEIFSS